MRRLLITSAAVTSLLLGAGLGGAVAATPAAAQAINQGQKKHNGQ